MERGVNKTRERLNQSFLKDIEVTEEEKKRILNNLRSRNDQSPSYAKYYWSLTAAAVIMLLLFLSTFTSFLDNADVPASKDPLSLINEEFQYHSFEQPGGWDIVTLTEELKAEELDMYNPENNVFEEIPLSYSIQFGE